MIQMATSNYGQKHKGGGDVLGITMMGRCPSFGENKRQMRKNVSSYLVQEF